MIRLMEFATIFRIAAFVLYILMTFEKKVLFFRNDFIYFIGIILMGGFGFYPQLIRILPYINWMGFQGILGVLLGAVFLGIVLYGLLKRKDKQFDGYNQLATIVLFLLMAQWFLLTSSANT